jgi:metal-responsive CopG/Arc/MetJ family transcriptional regulator
VTTRRITIEIDEKLVAAVDRAAKAGGTSRSAAARQLLERGVAAEATRRKRPKRDDWVTRAADRAEERSRRETEKSR